MNDHSQLITKYQELYANLKPIEMPEQKDLTTLRGWYRDEVMQSHDVYAAIDCIEQLMKLEGWDDENLLWPIKRHAKQQRDAINAIAKQLDLTPPEWPE